MAKGKKTGGRDFAPGKSPNPAGRPPLPESVKILRKLTSEKLQEIADLILDGNKQQLTLLANSQTESAIRVAYARAALNAMTKGDLTQIEIILARLIGKVKDQVHHTVEEKKERSPEEVKADLAELERLRGEQSGRPDKAGA